MKNRNEEQTDKMKLLTIAIPSYNSQDYLENCIKSLNPSDERLDIIIIDDGSTDDTARIADMYEAMFPDTVRAIHQKNGGHGSGINHGLLEARGIYFKTVDSDDVLSDDLPLFLDKLEECEKNGGVDLFVTDYRYIHSDGKGDRTIDFSNALPVGRIFSWEETHSFRIDQILMIHTCTFRTQLLHDNGVQLPIHTFYEDNYWIYSNLVKTNRIYYMHSALYRYTIGRAGQSVQEDVMMRRYMHQLTVTKMCFSSFHMSEVQEKHLRKYLDHEMFIMLGISILYARLNNTEESNKALKEMWDYCDNFDHKMKERYRHHSLLKFTCIPGNFGVALVRFFYNLAHKVVRFN